MKPFFQIVAFAAILALFAAPASVLADNGIAPTDNSDFGKCFCWDSATNNWCGASNQDDSYHAFWREPCNRLTINMFLWSIPAAALLLILVFFPFFFLAARMCCNCCGGRQPSYGCCCPDRAPPHVQFDAQGNAAPFIQPDGSYARQYSRRSIFVVKFLFFVAFGVYIYYAVGCYVTNARLHNDILDGVDVVSQTSTNAVATLNSSAQAIDDLSRGVSPFTTAADVATIQEKYTQYVNRDNGIQKVVRDLKRAEGGQDDAPWVNRSNQVYGIVSYPMIIYFVAAICALCNFRGAALTIAAGLLSWITAFVTLAFIVQLVFAQANVSICDNFNTTVVPLVVNVIQSREGCGTLSGVSLLNETTQAYASRICSSGLCELCSSGSWNCSALPCDCFGSTLNRVKTTGPMNIVDNFALTQIISALPAMSKICSTSINGSSGQCTIEECAQAAYDCPSQQVAANVMSIFAPYHAAIATITDAVIPSVYECNFIVQAMQGPLWHVVCNNAMTMQSTSLSVTLLACMVVATLSIVLVIMGAKRFQKMPPPPPMVESLALLGEEPATQQGLSPSAIANARKFVYGIVVQEPSDAMHVGQPVYGSTVPPVVVPQRTASCCEASSMVSMAALPAGAPADAGVADRTEAPTCCAPAGAVSCNDDDGGATKEQQ